jgi:DNA repair ATPase RecN
MKQGKTEKAVFAKLSKAELAQHEIKLESIQSVEKLIAKTKADTKVIAGLVSSPSNNLRDTLRAYQAQYINALTLSEEIEKALDNNSQAVDQLDYALSDFERKAKELGINPNELDIVKEAVKTMSAYEKEFSPLMDIKEDLQQALKSYIDPR